MTDRADEIVTSKDFPFETTVCPECGVRHSDIPALMKAAEQIRAYGDECRNAALEEAAKAVDDIDDDLPWENPTRPEDDAYSLGLDHALDAIRALKEPKP